MTDVVQIASIHATLRVDEASLQRLLLHVLHQENRVAQTVTVVLAHRATVLTLNRTYLNHDYPTDVLAFALNDDPVLEGEIYVDLDTAHERAPEFGASFEEEVFRYAIHGLLHLLGYTDKTAAGKMQMRTLEDQYLQEMRRN